MIKVGIVGGAGYTAGELLRLLVHHPEVEVQYVQSESQSGKPVSSVHKDLIGDIDLQFTKEMDHSSDVAFLCKGHGQSASILEQYPGLLDNKIIDLSQDFRLRGNHDFVYGLPESNSEQIKTATHVANPGCFATSIQLGLLPAIHANLVDSDIHVSGITGSTGAGQSFSETSHFSWRSNNASVYKPFTHQHLNEIGENFTHLNKNFTGSLHFIPYRGAFTRGIITTSYFQTDLSDQELKDQYNSYYESHPFTHVIDHNPDLKMVINTNKCVVFPSVINSQAMIVSVIDNLLKGASGQAVQNMNLISGLPEKMGLELKSSNF